MATPKILLYEVELRAVRLKRNLSRPVVYTNDLNSAEFQFKVIDMDAGDLSTATATTLLYMRDGSFFQNPKEDVSLVGTTFSYTLKENEGNHAGIAKIQLIVTIGEAEYATQLYEFEIINGLETKVAQEVMIYDWTMLTREARAYIDEFVANEILREAEFDNNEFDRNAAFNQAQTSRTTAYGIAEAARDADYEENEALRQAGYDADHSRAGTDHTRADDDHDLAGTDHTTAENDHTIADTDHTRAETDHTRADADSATVAGFNTRLAAEETATANNKISAVKGQTFADVDARLEDVEFDTTLMATNLAVNGDFSNGVSSWSTFAGTTVAGEYKFDTGVADFLYQSIVAQSPSKFYFAMKVYGGGSIYVRMYNLSANQLISDTATVVSPSNGKSIRSGVLTATGEGTQLRINRVQDTGLVYIDDVILINLTATFGKGNEPTAEQMDGIMAKFPNSWFNGTANLFRANETLNKLVAVDARTEFEAKNYIPNGDFSNGSTTGWIGTRLGIIAESNSIKGSFTDTGNLWGYIDYPLITKIIKTHKYYMSGEAKIGTAGNVDIRFVTNIGSTTSYQTTSTSFIRISSIVDVSLLTGATLANVRLYVSGGTAVGQTGFFRNITLIDLTEIFGAGKEPTLAEMDRLMARFPNSWFDGVKPIQTIETLYQEKANKVQEAWITPTLQNGATGDIQYRKNQQGRVEFRGSITFISDGLAVLTMPVGYRLAASATFSLAVPSTASTTSTQRNMFLNGGANWYPGYPLTARTIDFTGLSYVAEQ